MSKEHDDDLAQKSYDESIVGDIANMIKAAQESGMELQAGFENKPLETSNVCIRYMFLPKAVLANMPMPQSEKQKLKTSNVLGTVDFDGKPVGVWLLCSMPVPFADATEDHVKQGAHKKGIIGFKDALTETFRNDFKKVEEDNAAPKQ